MRLFLDGIELHQRLRQLPVQGNRARQWTLCLFKVAANAEENLKCHLRATDGAPHTHLELPDAFNEISCEARGAGWRLLRYDFVSAASGRPSGAGFAMLSFSSAPVKVHGSSGTVMD